MIIFFPLRVRNPDLPFYRTALFVCLVPVWKCLSLLGGSGIITYHKKASRGSSCCYVPVKISTWAKSLWGNEDSCPQGVSLSVTQLIMGFHTQVDFIYTLSSSNSAIHVCKHPILMVFFAHSCPKMEPLLRLFLLLQRWSCMLLWSTWKTFAHL